MLSYTSLCIICNIMHNNDERNQSLCYLTPVCVLSATYCIIMMRGISHYVLLHQIVGDGKEPFVFLSFLHHSYFIKRVLLLSYEYSPG